MSAPGWSDKIHTITKVLRSNNPSIATRYNVSGRDAVYKYTRNDLQVVDEKAIESIPDLRSGKQKKDDRETVADRVRDRHEPGAGAVKPKAVSDSQVISYTGKQSKAEYINRRCKQMNGKTVKQALASTYKNSSGKSVPYTQADLNYDMKGGRLTMVSPDKTIEPTNKPKGRPKEIQPRRVIK